MSEGRFKIKTFAQHALLIFYDKSENIEDVFELKLMSPKYFEMRSTYRGTKRYSFELIKGGIVEFYVSNEIVAMTHNGQIKITKTYKCASSFSEAMKRWYFTHLLIQEMQEETPEESPEERFQRAPQFIKKCFENK